MILPSELTGLDELALDLRWAWSHDLDQIWRRLNPQLWLTTRNPWLLLRSIEPSALEALAKDASFVEMLAHSLRERAARADSPAWFERAHPGSKLRRIAYFSMEYGISEALPIYAGGLGVLAGDYLKAASDLGVPLVGIGLLYQSGYFRQTLDASGAQLEFYPPANPDDLPIVPVTGRDGSRLRVCIALPGRDLHVRAWLARVGGVALYLLDANDAENSAADRGITSALYGDGPELRLQQEIVLGIGGWRLLNELGLEIDVCHLNEGHAAFAVLERARALMQRERLTFEVALTAVRPGNVFTTHTAVAAAFDQFDPHLIEQYFGEYAKELGISIEAFLDLGRGSGDNAFMPTRLALRENGAINAVSFRHGEVSRALFASLFPRWPLAEVPVGYVTNGVHAPTWDSPDADRVWTQACGKDRWCGDLSPIEQCMSAVRTSDLWGMRLLNRTRLVEFVRARLAQQLQQRGAPTSEIEAARNTLDPNALTIGFARRFASYKRPLLLLHDQERLMRLLNHPDRPVQIIVAGKAHPNDSEGKDMVRAWAQFARRDDVQGRVVFLSDYELLLSQELVQGVDLWVNTPRPPWEACGTSGMKVLVNGGLNLSELDGWWVEAYAPKFGWEIGTNGDDASDDAAARALYEKLEAEIAPMFYARDESDVPQAWVDRMRASMAELAPRFSSNRMIREYLEKAYFPAADAYHRRTAQNCSEARQVVTWRDRMRANWSGLRFGEPHITETDAGRRYEIAVHLGKLDPVDVAIELYADPVGDIPSEHTHMERVGEVADGMALYRTFVTTKRNVTDYTPRAIPHHADAAVPLETAQITWQR